MHISLGFIVGHSALNIQFNVLCHFLNELERSFFVVTLGVVIAQPSIYLIFTKNPIFLTGSIIISHDKIAEETKRFLIYFFKRARNGFPVHIQFFEFASINLTKHHILKQIHRVESLAPLVNCLKNF